MIIREWRGRATPARAAAYPGHFHGTVLPELRTIAGFLGASLSQREIEGEIEFLVLTRWQSLAVIRAFAGDAIERAVVEPTAVAALTSFDATVRHYAVIEEDFSPGKAGS